MSDRTEALLAELVELQRRTIANQERAIEGQAVAIATQREAVARQKTAMGVIRVLVVLAVVLWLGIPLLNWMLALSRR